MISMRMAEAFPNFVVILNDDNHLTYNKNMMTDDDTEDEYDSNQNPTQ